MAPRRGQRQQETPHRQHRGDGRAGPATPPVLQGVPGRQVRQARGMGKYMHVLELGFDLPQIDFVHFRFCFFGRGLVLIGTNGTSIHPCPIRHLAPPWPSKGAAAWGSLLEPVDNDDEFEVIDDAEAVT